MSLVVDTVAAWPLLGPFVEAEVLGPAELAVVRAVASAAPGAVAEDLLALGVVVRATGLGHVRLEVGDLGRLVLGDAADAGITDLPWPPAEVWLDGLRQSPIVAGPESAATPPLRPLVLEGAALYLQRYWQYEVGAAAAVTARAGRAPGRPGPGPDPLAPAAVGIALERVFPPAWEDREDRQRLAAERALTRSVSVLAGGPGTGKTHTVARLLAAAQVAAGTNRFRAALAAPTGKAAARMGEVVRAQVAAMRAEGHLDPATADAVAAHEPTTLHRLLGYRSRTRFRHDAAAPLPYDLVVVDETSMVALPLLARLLEALPADARLVLVGDPHQLASIDVGTVLADLVGPAGRRDAPGAGPLAGAVTELVRMHRFGERSDLAGLAGAVRTGDAGGAVDLLAAGSAAVRWVRPDDAAGLEEVRDEVTGAARAVVAAALAGRPRQALDAAQRVKVLAATRHGPGGRDEWSDRIAGAVWPLVPPAERQGRPAVGTPVMVTANDPVNGLANGDVGVVVLADGRRTVFLDDGGDGRELAPSRLARWEPWWAMTIHKSQGSEFPHAVVCLPEAGSPILSRELLYTAVTRAKESVTVVADEAALRAAVDHPITRASGLGARLWPAAGPGC